MAEETHHSEASNPSTISQLAEDVAEMNLSKAPEVITELPPRSETSSPLTGFQQANDTPETGVSNAPEVATKVITRNLILPPDYPPLEDPLDLRIPLHFVDAERLKTYLYIEGYPYYNQTATRSLAKKSRILVHIFPERLTNKSWQRK